MTEVRAPAGNLRRKLGEILVAAGVIDDLQLRSALGHQRQWGGRLGHILVDLRFIDDLALASTLAQQLGLELCDLTALATDIEVVRLLPQSVAERHAVFPTRFDAASGTLTVAFSDPTNLEAIDEVRFQTGKTIQLAVASEGQIGAAIRRFYYGEDLSADQAPRAEPSSLFGGIDGFLAPEEDDLAELEPIPSESQIPQTGTPNLFQERAAVAPQDPLSGFLEESPGATDWPPVPAPALVPPPSFAQVQVVAPALTPTPPLANRSPSAVPAPSAVQPAVPVLLHPVESGARPGLPQRRPSSPPPDPARPAAPPRLTPTSTRSLTPVVPEAPTIARESEDIFSQAVDLSKETVEGVLLPEDFLRELQAERSRTPAPPELPRATSVGPPFAPPVAGLRPASRSAALAPTREIPLMGDAPLTTPAGEFGQEPTRPGQPLAELLGQTIGLPGEQGVHEPTQPIITLSAIAAPPTASPPLAATSGEAFAQGVPIDLSFEAPLGLPSSPDPDPRQMPEASPNSSSGFASDFSEEDFGDALSGLEKAPSGNWHPAQPVFTPGEGQFARALARLLVKKGLIDEAELLAELAKD